VKFKLWQWLRRWRTAGAIKVLLPILIAPDKRLLTRCKVLHTVTSRVDKLAENMVETLHAAQGLGLAAPQVGQAVRLVVIDIGEGPRILLNPIILERDGLCLSEEGCLSVPGVIRRKTRWHRITYRYFDLAGNRIEESVEGVFAIVLQHEIDHLNGILIA
jgi:peptide deformylase